MLASTLMGAIAQTTPSHGKQLTKIKVCKRNRAAIRISPVALQKGSIRIISTCTRPLNFYVFDLDGALVSQAKVAPHEKAFIRNLPVGEFAYDVFMDDEGVEQGRINIH